MADMDDLTTTLAAHAPFDWNGGMYDCKCGWEEQPENWAAYVAHVANAVHALGYRKPRVIESGGEA